MSIAPLPPLECQVVAAGVATRFEAFQRHMANSVVWDNVRLWRDGHRDSDQGIPLPPVEQRVEVMLAAIEDCVARIDRRAT